MSPTPSNSEFPTSSSQGAMGPLLRKLDLLLDSKNQLIRRSAKEAIKRLKEDLEEINADLVELSMVERPNYKTRYWMQEVRELSYHIEDCIDNMMQSRAATAEAKVRFSGHRLRVRHHVKIPCLPKTMKPSATIAELRMLLWEASERHERYQLQDCVSSETRFLFSGNSRSPAVAAEVDGAADNLVGVDGTRGELTSWLMDQTEEEHRQLKVLSILGPAGVGKTALVKDLYRQLGHQFKCRAFVRVSRNPDMRRLLGEILAQVQGRKRDYGYEYTSTEDNLMDSIRSHLQDKRYFVVIDELWDAAAWDIMNIAFPKGNNCSRIIITAEGKDLASQCYCVDKLQMTPLENLQDSGIIFFDRVFGSEYQCPDQLKDISCMIIRSCGGFPLAITTVASLLASQIDNTELWDYLQQCFVSRLTGVTLEETCKEVVNICYDALPQDLKTCLLYLTMYPEGSTIRKADLLNQWIAEGFITTNEENRTVAESCFAELINRGMIHPEKIDQNDEVVSCTVHHIVFDLIAQKSREENFITAVDYSQAMPGFSMIAGRLTLHLSCAQFAAKPEGLKRSQVRSLAFYGLLKCMPSITEFKFLRVLILEFWGDNYHHNKRLDLSKLCILFHLRYLKVSSHTIIELPSKIQRLQSLETLEIYAKVSAVPSDILHLPGLLHLSLPNGTELPDGIGRITSLKTLEHFDLGSNSEYNVKSLGELINLQNLHVTSSRALSDHHLKRNLVALSSSIGKLFNLKSLRVGPFAVGMTMFIDQDDMPCTPKLLQRLELLPSSCIFSRLPTWIGGLEKLRILKIAVRVLLSSDIDTLTGLPVLAVLSLYVQKTNAGSVIFNSGSLPALKYFKYRCAALRLGFQKEALPNLQRLKLCFNVHKAESYTTNLAGIENLLKLKEITAEIGAAAGAHESDRRAAESALKEATRKHPRFPMHMNVKSVDCIESEMNFMLSIIEIPTSSSLGAMGPLLWKLDSLSPLGATSNLHRAAGLVSNHFEYEIGSWLPPQAMPLELLRQITNNFSERLGRGTFGTVYKGVLNNGQEVAVKLLHSMPERFEFEEEEFWKELENLRRLNHPNIVQLLGYCYGIEQECVEHNGRFVVADKITRALCLEYMHNTSLQGYLDDESVDWQTRYKIILGTCEGLQYLHKGLENPMLHLDLKPGNILLDQNMVPKLADFGLSKLIYDSKTQTASKFIGTRRYCPPEHFKGLQFSRKFDIFSLGVVMIEIIAGSKGYDKTADEMPSHEFLDHVQENWIKRIHQATMDCASPKCGCRQVKTCIEIALECVHPERMQRPNIEDILSRLNETEHNTEKSATTASSQNEK